MHLGLDSLPAGVAAPAYDRRAVRAGIAHIGVGNFHRSHQAVYIDELLSRGGSDDWGIVGIGIGDGPAAREKARRFREQDCLYTLTVFDPDGTSSSRVVGSIVGYLHAPSEPDAVHELLRRPELRIVTLTITEGGYGLDDATGELIASDAVKADLAGGAQTVFGFLVRALAARRDAGVPPFTVVSCDNLRSNGDTARAAVTGFARMLDPELAGWIDENVAFPNSMVDRIAPSVGPAEAERLNALTGVPDLVPVMTERYSDWVIEDAFPAGRPPLEEVGVQLRDDVHLFEAMKGRVLNASHVLMSYPALLLGHRLVHDGIGDERIRRLVEVFQQRDTLPIVQGPEGVDLAAYAASVTRRFSNAALGDQLERVASDGLAKIVVFHTRTAIELAEAGGDLRRIALLLACYRRYLGGMDGDGGAIQVLEPTLGAAGVDALRDDPDALLAHPAFAEWGFERHPELVAAYRRAVAVLDAEGADAAIAAALA